MIQPKTVCLAVATLLLASGANAQVPEPSGEIGRFNESECLFEVPEALNRDVECGFVTVPAFHKSVADARQRESRENEPGASTFRLPVAVFRSRAETVKPDPLVYLNGGPGSNLIPGLALSVYGALDLAAPDRDIILYDQRGASAADPQFICQDFNAYIGSYRGAIDEAFKETTRKLIAECLDRLTTDVGIDFRAFNSLEHAADVETIRKALNIESLNILGSSYGAKLALVVMRHYPDSIRSAVLGSVLPLSGDSTLIKQSSFESALMRTFEICATDPLCAEAYPNLELALFQATAELEANPLVLEGPTPADSFTIDSGRLATALADIYGSGTFNSSVPRLIYAAAGRDEDFLRGTFGVPNPQSEMSTSTSDTPTQSSTQPENQAYNPSLREAVFTGYMCNEEVEFVLPEVFAAGIYAYAPIAEYYAGKPTNSLALYDYCEQLGITEPVASELNEPVFSEIPALVVNGGLDPITGPAFAREVADNLAAQFILFPGGSHGITLSNTCAATIMGRFLDTPSRTVEASCAEDARVGFATDIVREFEPFTLEPVELAGVYPANWAEVSPGVVQRYFVGNVRLTQTKIAGDEQAALEAVTTAGGAEPSQSRRPRRIDRFSANGLNWSIYRLRRDSGVLNYIATAPQKGNTVAAVLTLTGETALEGYYYDAVFIPAVKALRQASTPVDE